MIITGPGASQLAISGQNSVRVLSAQNATATTISGLTIKEGQAPAGTFSGGGGIVSGGDMTLDHVVVTDNHATASGGSGASVEAVGAGIEASGGTLTLIRSTVRNNDANATTSGGGSAVSYGGGIWLSSGTLHLLGSLIYNNQANATVNTGSGDSTAWPGGGGIYTYQGTVTIDQSTIVGNSVTATGATRPNVANFAVGGGIYQDNVSSLAVTGATISDNSVGTPGGPFDPRQGANLELLSGGTFRSTIVADPVGAENCVGTFTSQGYNLEDDSSPASNCHFTQATDIAGQNPNLAPPADNGGPTLTQALPANSPAIDKGKSFGATMDQRGPGFPRISDSPTIANAPNGGGADIGAFERDSVPPHVTAPVQSLLPGTALGAGSTPEVVIHFGWSASDAITPAPQLQSFLQMRTNSGGTWGPFATIGGPTFAQSRNAALSGSILRQFRVRVKDQAGNFGTSPLGPPFRITTYQEQNPAVAYTGTWHQTNQATASGGAVKYSTQVGAKATLTSNGRNLAVVMPWRPTDGKVRICLDPGTAGASCQAVDLSPAPGIAGPRRLVFIRDGLNPTGTHKVVVTVLSGKAELDAFVALR